ncbi:MAG: glucose 1-dehydrogenase [Actinomycetota bacterium]|nr:glucose 1-dehydrogenase [Actinomycetota bacterium]
MTSLPTITEMIDLSGKRALVTGGGKGIGAAIAARLVEAGAEVTIADIDPDIHKVAEELSVSFTNCDITVPEQLQTAVQQAANGSSLDILINNAGIYPPTGPIPEASDEFVTRMLDLNVRAQYSASREAINYMDGGGSIVNISSIAALRGGASITAYSTSKAAVIGLTKAFANELGPQKIRVNAIAPGIIDTEGLAEQGEALRKGGIDVYAAIAANPLKLSGDPDYIARAALFLASDLAEFITGHLLVVDGGSTA